MSACDEADTMLRSYDDGVLEFVQGNVGSQRNMMNEVDIENLTTKQYLMLTQENRTQRMVRTESGRMINKDIDDMTIAEYIEYEAKIKRDPWGYTQTYTRNSGSTTLGGSKILKNNHHPDKLNDNIPSNTLCFKPAQPLTEDMHELLEKDKNDYYLSTPNSQYETEKDKEEEEDAVINILKTVVEECKSIYKKTQIQTPSSRTSEIQEVPFVAEEEEGDRAGINMMPKSLFEHLKLTNLKKTSMVVEMAEMTKKCPIRNCGKYPNVFRGEISLGIGNEKAKFDKTGEICQSRVPLEIFYMTSSIQKGEYFNPYEVKNDVFTYDSLALEQKTLHYSKESIDTVDSSNDSQEDKVGSHLSEDVVSRWHVCTPIHVTFKVCEEDCEIWPTYNPDLSFCSGYDAIYGKEKNGMLKQWVCFRDHERQSVRGNGIKFVDFLKVRDNSSKEWVKENFDFEDNLERTKNDPYSRNFNIYKEEFDNEIKQLENEYKLKAGRKKYALEEVWEKCKKFQDSTKLWYDKGFKEEELWKNGIEEMDYTPSLVKSENFEVHRYTFKKGKSFISITKQNEDILTLGRVNRYRFMEKTKKEMDEEGGTTRKTILSTKKWNSRDQVSISAKDKGFGHEMHKGEVSEAVYGVTPPKDYAVTYSNEEMNHHTLYGVKPLLLYTITFKFTRDDLSESALRSQAPGVVKLEIGGNVNFEIKSQFMRELREDTFSGNKNDDAHEHVERVLDIVSLFNIPGVSHDAVMLRVFPITLTGAAKRWVNRLPPETVDSWDLLKKAFIQRYCPPSKTAK
ncbi:phospholipase-like protein [Tanacetum coccineum]